MSDNNDRERLLQILETHGQQFLNSFKQPPKPPSGRGKLDDSSGSSEEDEEWHGFGTGGASSGDSEDGNSMNSCHGALQFIIPDSTSTYGRRV